MCAGRGWGASPLRALSRNMQAKPSPTGSTRRAPRDVKPLLWLATAVIAALALLVAGTNSCRSLAAIRHATPVATSAAWEGAPQAGTAQKPAYQIRDPDLETLRQLFYQYADQPPI